MTLPGRRGQIASTTGSPLPQDGAGGGAQAVRLTSAFTQFLPPRSFVFFQRAYFRAYPRPLQVGAKPPYPIAIPIARIQVPSNQGLIIRHSSFKVFEASGVGVDDIVEVDKGRATRIFGFQTQVGQRGLTDFSTNVTANGDPVVWNPAQQIGATAPPQVGSAKIYPFVGDSQAGLENFASYAEPGQEIELAAWVMRAPPFDTRLFSAELTGYLVGWVQLQKILDKLSG